MKSTASEMVEKYVGTTPGAFNGLGSSSSLLMAPIVATMSRRLSSLCALDSRDIFPATWTQDTARAVRGVPIMIEAIYVYKRQVLDPPKC